MSQFAFGIWRAAARDAPDTDEAPVWQGSLSWLAFQCRLDREAIEAAEQTDAEFMAGSKPYGSAA